MEIHKLASQQKEVLKLISENEFEHALKLIDNCIKISEKTALNYFLKGRIHDEMLDYPASISAYRKCIARDPNNRKAKFYLSLAYLALEDFNNGCRYYGYRHDPEILKLFTKLKTWSPPKKPGRVLIWAEQGIGDEVMFLRFLPLLEQLPFQFTLQCDGRLISTLEFNYPWLKFIPRKSILDFKQFQYHLPIGDLLRIFYKRITEISHQFLKAHSNQKIDQVLAGHLGKSLIGLSWLSMSEDYGIRRSLPVETFLRELDPQRVVVVSLQYLAPKTEIAKIRAYGFQVIDEIDCYQDIEAVFSIMSQCDKVMTIDNSVAHFAGALGVVTEVRIPNLANWRWGLEGTRTYWYPSVTLKRIY